MANPSGVNQLGVSQPYGEISRQLELKRQAPISGATVSGRALDTPRRVKQAAARRPAAPPTQPAAQGGTASATAAEANPPPNPVQVAMLWQAAASDPGASDLVREYALQAAKDAGIG